MAWANREALEAGAAGTFCVGGVLLGPDGTLLASSRNRVLEGGVVLDPTAHGERQLVDWYFQQAGDLPPAGECTIVSTLDPCLMCAGAILQAGFQVVTLALDPSAGVNYTADFRFPTLSAGLRERAQATFRYLGVEGQRPYQGNGTPEVAPAELERETREQFWDSVRTVQSVVHGEPAREGPRVVGTMPQDAEAALFDPGGRVLHACAGRPGIRTAVMELTRYWAGRSPHFKDCTLMTRRGPGPDALSLMEIGAFGSSVEGPLPVGARWLYLEEGQPAEDLERLRLHLPPLYRDVIGIRFSVAHAGGSRI